MGQVTAVVVPRNQCASDVEWIYKTRMYISHFDARKIYFLSFSGDKNEDVPPPDASTWASINKEIEQKDILLTALISAPTYFGKESIISYIKNPITKDLGIALAISESLFDEIISVANHDEIILYLENNNLVEEQLPLVNDTSLLNAIMNRITDKKKVMYTTLLNNFYRIVTHEQFSKSDIFNEAFISKYIEHASLYSKDALLEYLLINFRDIHPVMSTMDCLSWDPFTRSRRYSHWLRVCTRMNELSRYYMSINQDNDTIRKNAEHLKMYNEYILKYGGRH
ncbi:hypothetical protein ABKX88_000805 [Aeromonas veronii]